MEYVPIESARRERPPRHLGDGDGEDECVRERVRMSAGVKVVVGTTFSRFGHLSTKNVKFSNRHPGVNITAFKEKTKTAWKAWQRASFDQTDFGFSIWFVQKIKKTDQTF